MNYFEFMGIEPKYNIDEKELKQIYLNNSKAYHPDFHTSTDSESQNKMLNLSALNNLAYKVLSKSEKRLEYIFEINNYLSSGDENLSKITLSQDFLMEMMDFNDQIELLENQDKTSLKNEILAIYDQNQLKINELMIKFDSFQANEIKKMYLDQAFEFFLQQKYLRRLLTQC